MQPEKKLIRIMTALICEPWLLSPQMHKTLTDIARAHATGGKEEADQHAIAAEMQSNPKKREFCLVDNVAIIPCEGIVGRKFDSVLYSSGVTSVDIFTRLVQTAAADEEVDALLLSFDSPGGQVMGTPEAAKAVANARAVKPVVSYADGLCDSAAYWIASQADVVYATPSADVGCIGCYMALIDSSRAYETEGYHVNLFKSGKYKGMGYPGTSLTDEQRAMLQSDVDRIAAEFKAAVRSGRGRNISDDVMQGQSFSVEEAQRVGLIDSVAEIGDALRDARQLKNMRK